MSERSFDPVFVRAQATKMRIDIVEMLCKAGSGHPGGSLSAADIVATLYFGGVLNFDSKNVDDPNRDRFILSKGHAAPVQYAALVEAGVIERTELESLRQLGAMLQGHPDASKTQGVEVSTGSLGQGLSISCGVASALKMNKSKQHVYCLMGDGELQEGQVWEAAMFAAHYKLDNLTAIVDLNKLQIDGSTDEVMAVKDPGMRFFSFGFEVIECNGHDIEMLHHALTTSTPKGKPKVIIAHTQKGHGVSFMQNKACWHGVAPTVEETTQACGELKQCTAYQGQKLSAFKGITAKKTEGSN